MERNNASIGRLQFLAKYDEVASYALDLSLFWPFSQNALQSTWFDHMLYSRAHLPEIQAQISATDQPTAVRSQSELTYIKVQKTIGYADL